MKFNYKYFIWLGIFLVVIFIYKFINKDSLIDVIFKNLPPREASLMAGMVFGDKNSFDKNTILNFKDSGVIHIMVVSGTNIVLVFLGLIVLIFGKIILWLSFPLLKYILLIVDWLVGFKWSSIEIRFNWVVFVVGGMVVEK